MIKWCVQLINTYVLVPHFIYFTILLQSPLLETWQSGQFPNFFFLPFLSASVFSNSKIQMCYCTCLHLSFLPFFKLCLDTAINICFTVCESQELHYHLKSPSPTVTSLLLNSQQVNDPWYSVINHAHLATFLMMYI